MRLLVTGCMGYIGCVMVPVLVSRGHDVVGMDSDLYARCTYCGSPPDIPLMVKDIRDAQASDLRDIDAVVHLAALSNDPLGDLNPNLTHEINCLASVRLAGLARSAGVERFLFSSSCSVYGASDDRILTEESQTHPVTPYGASKLEAERRIATLARSGFVPVFLRSSTAYGLSPRIRFDLVLNNLVAWACTTGQVMLKSDGTPWRPIVHVEDISAAFSAVLEADADQVCNQAFNVGRTADNHRIRDLAQIVRETVSGSRIVFAPGAGPDKRCYRVDCGKLSRTLPQFRPEWDARRGAQQLYQAYRKCGLSQDEFEGSRFKRIAHLKQLLERGLVDDTFRPRQTPTQIVSRPG